MTRSLPDSPIPMYDGDRERPIRVRSKEESWNLLTRFWEACGDSPVGGRLTDLSNPISIEQYEGKDPIA